MLFDATKKVLSTYDKFKFYFCNAYEAFGLSHCRLPMVMS